MFWFLRKSFFVVFLLLALVILFTIGRAAVTIWKVKGQYPVLAYVDDKTPPLVSFSARKPSHWVRLNEVPKVALGAILVSEDAAFFEHHGLDFHEIREAIKEDLHRKKYARGASTITQQVVKNLFLSKEKKITRKIQEAIWAVLLETRYTKREILELYINIAEWGRGVYGIRKAADRYFQMSPSALDAKSSAFLAMLLPSPKKYGISFYEKKLTPFAQKRVDIILARMVKAGYVSKDEAERLAYFPLNFEEPNEDLPVEADLDNDSQ